MTVTTTTQIAAPVNRINQTDMLRQARQRCVYFHGSKAANIERRAGSLTAIWRRAGEFSPSTTALTELSTTLTIPTRTGTALSIDTVTAALAKYGGIAYLTEETDISNPNPYLDEAALSLGIAGGRSLNRLQRNILEDNLTTIYASGGSADGDVSDPITNPLIANGINTLQRNSAMKFADMTMGSVNIGTQPIREAFWGLSHVDVEEDIRALDKFKPVETYASQTSVARGEFGEAGGVRWISSEEGSIDADSGGSPGSLRSNAGTAADLYPCVILGREAHLSLSLDIDLIENIYQAGDDVPALQMIRKPFGSAGVGDVLDEVMALAYKAWHAGAIANTDWGRVLRVGASKLQ